MVAARHWRVRRRRPSYTAHAQHVGGRMQWAPLHASQHCERSLLLVIVVAIFILVLILGVRAAGIDCFGGVEVQRRIS